MELPFVRLTLEEGPTTDEILTDRRRQLKQSNTRAKSRLRHNAKLVQSLVMDEEVDTRLNESVTPEPNHHQLADSDARLTMMKMSRQKADFWSDQCSSDDEIEESVTSSAPAPPVLQQSNRNGKKGIDLYAASKALEEEKHAKRMAWQARQRQQDADRRRTRELSQRRELAERARLAQMASRQAQSAPRAKHQPSVSDESIVEEAGADEPKKIDPKARIKEYRKQQIDHFCGCQGKNHRVGCWGRVGDSGGGGGVNCRVLDNQIIYL